MDKPTSELEYLESLFSDAPAPELEPNAAYAQVREHAAFRGFGMGAMLARTRHRAKHGYVYVTQEQATLMAKLLQGKRCLEVAAGTGWLSHLLLDKGVDVLASDMGGDSFAGYEMQHVWQRHHEGDSLSLLPGEFDAVILTWPAYDAPFGHQVLQAMRAGQVLFFEGEGKGGCTADDAFFETLEDAQQWRKKQAWTQQLNEHHLHFSGLHDRWSVWQKLI